MFEQNKYKIPLDNFISNNPNFTRTDLENQLSRLGIYTGATPNRSINRDVLKYLRKNLPEFDKKTTKEIRKNDKCRFDSLLDAVISKVPEVQYIDDGGYSSSRDSSGEFSPFQFESAYLVVKTSETSTFYDGAVTLTDTNETPC